MIAGLLLAGNVVLAAGLAAAALRPRSVVVVPSARESGELRPGEVPDEALRAFAVRYVLHFDNFTPSTLDAGHDVLRRMIAARAWSGASEVLEKRKRIALEGRMSSQAVPLASRIDGARVVVEAVRRTFIADKLSRETRVRYVVSVERQPPTDANPFGLGVVAQEIEEEAPPKAD